MKSRIPVLVVVACLLVAFIAFEVHSVMSELGGGTATASRSDGGPGDLGNPPKPTVSYPELCIALVRFDREKKLSAEQRRKIVPLLKDLDKYAQQMHAAEASLQEVLSDKQMTYIQQKRQELMNASVTPGQPPLSLAMRQFNVPSSQGGR